MDYQIAFPPELGLDAAAFIAAWNRAPDCRAVAEARPGEPGAVPHFDPTLLQGALAVLGSVALGVATNALYDLIKGALTRAGVREGVQIVQLDQPDGTRLLVITIVDD
jgi:hypothetical protein